MDVQRDSRAISPRRTANANKQTNRTERSILACVSLYSDTRNLRTTAVARNNDSPNTEIQNSPSHQSAQLGLLMQTWQVKPGFLPKHTGCHDNLLFTSSSGKVSKMFNNGLDLAFPSDQWSIAGSQWSIAGSQLLIAGNQCISKMVEFQQFESIKAGPPPPWGYFSHLWS